MAPGDRKAPDVGSLIRQYDWMGDPHVSLFRALLSCNREGFYFLVALHAQWECWEVKTGCSGRGETRPSYVPRSRVSPVKRILDIPRFNIRGGALASLCLHGDWPVSVLQPFYALRPSTSVTFSQCRVLKLSPDRTPQAIRRLSIFR